MSKLVDMRSYFLIRDQIVLMLSNIISEIDKVRMPTYEMRLKKEFLEEIILKVLAGKYHA